mmetsp:Transcript_19780/g.36913  ORF Transcript_19780/g.36913 Transcript_19780/m.36913 type:complete len:508 (-) Transcript_19780:1631-3154(-)|eukprot:CAMPEP_0178745116 /NCGR_PEP_ID=MMETSP0744-20121128/7129_1 /TAXON_ID=913974 /ORGANISM="Nitzschia punctata, Strain CCMP561" /LENGTH=507 /DNA_ID=CAMNT_0020398289 /DNA_START=53 /DNA_END=1576 /DNA_ORIENTATION=+
MASCAATRTIVTTTCRVHRNSRSVSSSSSSPSSSAPRNDTAPLWFRSTRRDLHTSTSPFLSGSILRQSVSLGPNAANAAGAAAATTTAGTRTCANLSSTVKSTTSLARQRCTRNGHARREFSSFSTATDWAAAVAERQRSFLMAAASVAVLAFVTATTSPESTTAASASKIARGTGGGGGGGSGPSLKTIYPHVLNERKAEDDIRRWEENTSNEPYQVSDSAVQGARWTMEDAYTVANGGHFSAVFDGHGGASVSGMLRDRVHALYTEALPKRHLEENEKMGRSGSRMSSLPSIQTHISAIRSALNRVERDVLKIDDLEYQGSTAVVVIVHEDDYGERTLVTANIGDSRAVLCRGGKAVELTKDHKPDDEREKARIKSMGADIQWDPYGQLYRVNDLSLSRAVGDRFAKPVVSSEAEIESVSIIDGEDEFFVLASDGLWDVMSSQEVVDYVHEVMDDPSGVQTSNGKIILSPEVRKAKMARILANEALERGSADNVCVILVWLDKEK